MRAKITVDSSERDFLQESLRLRAELNSRVSVAEFVLIGGSAPAGKDEVYIERGADPYESMAILPAAAMGGRATYLDDFFGGEISQITTLMDGITPLYHCVAQDFNIWTTTVLVTESYDGQTAAQIIADLFSTYLSDIDTSDVAAGGATITIAWTREYLDKVLDELAEIFGKKWYIDYNKHIQWVTPTDDTAPFSLSDEPYLTAAVGYSEHEHTEDYSRIINKVTVVGDDTVPVVETRNDATSQTAYGVKEDKIVDQKIDTAAWAQLVGDACLAENKDPKVNGRLVCLQEGLVVGQKVRVINSLKSIDAQYTVQSLSLSMIGAQTERVEVTYGDYIPGLTDMLKKIRVLESKEV